MAGVLSAQLSGITETGIGSEVEVEAGLVLEGQASHLPVHLAHHNHLRCDDRRDLELLGEFFFVPDLPVCGFKCPAVESGWVDVVRRGSVLS